MRVRYGYPRDGLNAILILVIINFIIFFATLIRSELIYFLGFQPAAFLSRPWTVVTAMFVHAGFWHIFANMITLYFFGSYFSTLVGRGRFLLVYFAGGIIGNLLFWVLASPFAVAVGASGAVFALAGGLVVMRPKLPGCRFHFPQAGEVSLLLSCNYRRIISTGVAGRARYVACTYDTHPRTH